MVKQTRYQSSQCGELRLQKKDQVIKIKVDDEIRLQIKESAQG